MRAMRVPVFVLAVVTAYILCNAAWVTGESQQWLDAADRVSDAALRGDVSAAGTALDTLDALWQEHQGYLHIVISHTELDEAEALLAAESRCTDLYVLARPDAAQMAPGQELRMTPVML